MTQAAVEASGGMAANQPSHSPSATTSKITYIQTVGESGLKDLNNLARCQPLTIFVP